MIFNETAHGRGVARPVRNAAILAFLLAGAWSLFVFRDPGMQDYANHLARAFILLHQSDPSLHRLYSVQWTPIPDLGWDLWALVFGGIFPLQIAAKLFLCAYLVLALGGVFAINRTVTSTLSLTPLLAVPFLFHGGYTRGFLNFDLGAAIALWAIAWWLTMPERRWLLRLAGATAFSMLLYFTHFFAWAAYGVVLLGLELPRLWRQRAGALFLLRDGLQALPPLMLFAMTMLGGRAPATGVMYESPKHRLLDLLQLMDSGHVWLNVILFVSALGLTIFAVRRQLLRFSPRLGLSILFCILFFFAIPDVMFGTSSTAWRIVVFAVLLGIASLSPAAGRPGFAVLLGGAFAVTLIIGVAAAANAIATEREETLFIQAIAPMPEGAKLFWAHSGIGRASFVGRMGGAYHLGALAVEDRHALVQSMFTMRGQQVLRFRDADFNVPKNSETFLPDILTNLRDAHRDARSFILHFDYVLLEGPGDAKLEAALPQADMRLVRQVGDCRLYRITHTPR